MVFQYREGCGPIDSTAIDRAFMEYGMDPMDLGPKNEAIPRVSVATGSGSRPIRTDLPSSLPAYETSERSMLLVDILYALSARRAGINEGDLRDIFCEALGIRGSFLLWDLVRSWIENCLLNRISSAKWRGSTYFAVRPHLCVLQNGTPSRVVLRGLASSSMRKAVGAEMKKIGGRKIKRFAPCDLVPVPDIWEADSASSFEAVASVVGLRFFTLPTPVLCPLREISVIAPPAPTRFETHRKWDWEKGTFADPAKTQEGVSTEIAWRRRDDAPDHFRISKDGTETFWTKSRNWALLLGYALEGRKAFSMNDRSTLVRSLKGGVYIPLVQGRFLSATSPIVPGPVIGNLTTTYSYPFHSAEDAAKFMDMFWGKTPLNVQLLKSLSGWLFAEAARAARRKENAVMLPEPYRRIFAEMGGFPQGIALSLARYPQESIPIITRRLDALGVER
jgi:hypothetical protein